MVVALTHTLYPPYDHYPPQDFRFILSRLRHWFPYHSFYGVGISAGSSLLARYLGGTCVHAFGAWLAVD